MRNGNLFWGWGESPKIGFTKSLAPLFIQMSGLHAPTVYFLTTHGSLNFPRGDHQWCLNYMMFLSIPHPTPPPHVLALTVLNILSNVELSHQGPLAPAYLPFPPSLSLYLPAVYANLHRGSSRPSPRPERQQAAPHTWKLAWHFQQGYVLFRVHLELTVGPRCSPVKHK